MSFVRGTVYRGHTLPYGTLVGASPELRKTYYTYCLEKELPDLPVIPTDGLTWYSDLGLHLKADDGKFTRWAEAHVSPRVFRVLYMRYTMDMTLEEIGNQLRLSKERIRQIENKAIRNLKTHFKSERLDETNYY